LTVENGVLNYQRNPGGDGDAKLALAKTTLEQIQLGQTSDARALLSGEMHVEGGAARSGSSSTYSTEASRDLMS